MSDWRIVGARPADASFASGFDGRHAIHRVIHVENGLPREAGRAGSAYRSIRVNGGGSRYWPPGRTAVNRGLVVCVFVVGVLALRSFAACRWTPAAATPPLAGAAGGKGVSAGGWFTRSLTVPPRGRRVGGFSGMV